MPDSARLQPILRWAGGKRQILGRLLDRLPEDVAKRRYFEPFLGAGSLFFALRPEASVVSDANAHLISCYEAIRDNSMAVARCLARHQSKHSSGYYYKVRQRYNESSPCAAQAARFIYLNQSCFNGIFRVNKQGQFNVPCGDKIRPRFPSCKQLVATGELLGQATLKVAAYSETLSLAAEGDFVYLDPPYPPLNGTAYFTHYTADRFDSDNQTELAASVREADRKGALIMMSNADTPLIRDLYAGYTIEPIPVTRYVTCKKKKHRVSELIITNYRAHKTPRQ